MDEDKEVKEHILALQDSKWKVISTVYAKFLSRVYDGRIYTIVAPLGKPVHWRVAMDLTEISADVLKHRRITLAAGVDKEISHAMVHLTNFLNASRTVKNAEPYIN